MDGKGLSGEGLAVRGEGWVVRRGVRRYYDELLCAWVIKQDENENENEDEVTNGTTKQSKTNNDDNNKKMMITPYLKSHNAVSIENASGFWPLWTVS